MGLKPWFVIHAKGGLESRVEREIKAISIQAYCPLEPARRLAFLPCYLFARFDPRIANWTKILRIRGVKDILSNGGIPSPVRGNFVSNLRKELRLYMLNQDNQQPLPVDFKPDEIVEVKEGPFFGLQGIVERTKGERIAILLYSVGNFKVDVNRSALAKVSNP